jgi:hypothetical protein
MIASVQRVGVGAGNTPVYLEKTAQLDMAVVDIITSKTFMSGAGTHGGDFLARRRDRRKV